MDDASLVARYNYDKFVPANFQPRMNFEKSPPLGQPAPDFPLWDLEGHATRLSAAWSQQAYLIVEFGSFT